VLSTPEYVTKYWTSIEYESAAAHAPERIILLDLGALPDYIPPRAAIEPRTARRN
jgi:hypothetical protein